MSEKKIRQARRRMTECDRENLRAREERKKRHVRELQEAMSNRVSYVKKPFANRSFMAVELAVASLVFFLISLYLAVKMQGQAGLTAAAVSFCSMLTGVISLWYGITSFTEKEKNYILARISVAVSGTLLLVWFIMMIAGR